MCSAERMAADPFGELIAEYLSGRDEVTVTQVLTEAIELPSSSMSFHVRFRALREIMKNGFDPVNLDGTFKRNRPADGEVG